MTSLYCIRALNNPINIVGFRESQLLACNVYFHLGDWQFAGLPVYIYIYICIFIYITIRGLVSCVLKLQAKIFWPVVWCGQHVIGNITVSSYEYYLEIQFWSISWNNIHTEKNHIYIFKICILVAPQICNLDFLMQSFGDFHCLCLYKIKAKW